ncbi:hypothetical protein [Methanimicrococcus hongohii]|uniref:hypothetical protein n=1 Tax=Methanimicrococcus hongohii TaxID=3028295 RepID=UPI002931E2AB|nr:hypothetical protein [Methanimicrococcus sp. Hf6]
MFPMGGRCLLKKSLRDFLLPPPENSCKTEKAGIKQQNTVAETTLCRTRAQQKLFQKSKYSKKENKNVP